MKKFLCLISLALICVGIQAQVYVYGGGTKGLTDEFNDTPDSIIIKPYYRTPLPAQNTGCLPGVFSASKDRKIRFSRSNLNYNIASGTWFFSEHQYDTVGGDISKPAIDQFGFGTSGWEGSGTTAYLPTDTSSVESDYQASIDDVPMVTLTGYMEQRDFGIYNPVINGGNKPGLWRMPSYNEWNYMLLCRWTPYAVAIVNNVWGIVLLPDGWNEEPTLKLQPCYYDKNWKDYTTLTEDEISAILAQYDNDTLSYGVRNSGMISIPFYSIMPGYKWSESEPGEAVVDNEHTIEDYNITPEEWHTYEAKGCVFLPFNKSRNYAGSYANNTRWQYYCTYASSLEYGGILLTHGYNNRASMPWTFIIHVAGNNVPPAVGSCVRLIQDF